MAFLYPGFLWALSALAIPIAVHLFHLRRYRKLPFSDVRLLKEVTQRTSARKQVRHRLTLLARLLAMTALILAFAQPYLPSDNGTTNTGDRHVSLYIDDSWSMDGQNPRGRLLDQARSDAQDAISAHGATTRYQVLTNRFEGRQQLLIGRDDALTEASRVTTGPFVRDLGHVMQRQREAMAQSDAPVKRAFLFTDLQRNVTAPGTWSDDTTMRTVIVPLPHGSTDNLSVDSLWFASPVRRMGAMEELHVRVSNRGPLAHEAVPVQLTIDGRTRAMATISVAANAQADTVLHFLNDAAGPHAGRVAISDRPVTFDDDLHFAYRTIDRIRVLLMTTAQKENNSEVAAVLAGDSAIALRTRVYSRMDLGELASTDLVVIDGPAEISTGLADALDRYVRAGGSLAVFPGRRSEGQGYSTLLQRFGASYGPLVTTAASVERIDLQAPFFRDVFTNMPRNVDLPSVAARYPLRVPAGADVLLQLRNGEAFLADVPVERGRAFLCATALDAEAGNFQAHALFVTALLRMTELARPSGALYHVIGAEPSIPLEGVELAGDAVPRLVGSDGTELIPEVRRTLNTTALVLHDPDHTPGPYAVVLDKDTLATVALNLDRSESDLRYWEPAELRKALEAQGLKTFQVLEGTGDELAVRLRAFDSGTRLWKWCILAALLFLALEILLIRTRR